MHSKHVCRSVGKLFKKSKNPLFTQKCRFYNPIQETVELPKHVRMVEFRSDTFSKPSWEMRKVMYEAQVGDDVYGEDPTVAELEQTCATLLGKEAALFVPSGTMANLLAIMTHSTSRGCEVIVGDESHIIIWEQAGAAQIAGAQLRTVINKPDGTFDIDEMISKVRDKNNSMFPKTSLVCFENTHNTCGGRITPLPWIRQLGGVLRELQLPLHMDGSRFFNAMVRTGIPAEEFVRDCDSINICLSKGLGAPIGSLLIGSQEFILKARHLRKVLGGGMRQVGLIAAAGLYALNNMVDRLREDHIRTYSIAEAIHDMRSDIVKVDLDVVETNILLIQLDTTKVTADSFCKRLAMVTDDDLKEEICASVKLLPWKPSIARLVLCCNNDEEDVRVAIQKLKRVIWEYENGIFIT